MQLALLNLQSLAAPVHAFARWCTARPMAPRRSPRVRREIAIHSIAKGEDSSSTRVGFDPRQRPAPALRVLRVVEPGEAPSLGRRIVISGRLDEVCAELDRLAALEATAGRRPR
jgi:hypothetical protein